MIKTRQHYSTVGAFTLNGLYGLGHIAAISVSFSFSFSFFFSFSFYDDAALDSG
jgi:hypothetical protein